METRFEAKVLPTKVPYSKREVYGNKKSEPGSPDARGLKWPDASAGNRTVDSLQHATSMLSVISQYMPQLIVRQVEDRVVKKLKARAGLHGVSMEEEHRRILREALLGKAAKRPSFKDYLLEMPDIAPDRIFERAKDKGRKVAL